MVFIPPTHPAVANNPPPKLPCPDPERYPDFVEAVACKDGWMLVDWSTVSRLCKSYVVHKNINFYGREMAQSQKTWDPRTWILDDLVQFDVDWAKVERETPRMIYERTVKMRKGLWNHTISSADARAILGEWMLGATTYKQTWQDRQHDITQKSMSIIARDVKQTESWIKRMEMTRNVSATMLCTIAPLGGLATGALVGLGVGSGLSAAAKMQDAHYMGADTGNLLATGAVEFGGQFVFGLIGGYTKAASMTLSTKQEFWLAAIKSSHAGFVAYLQGKKVEDIIMAGTLKFSEAWVGMLFKRPEMKEALSRWTAPISARINFVYNKEMLNLVKEAYIKQLEQGSKNIQSILSKSVQIASSEMLKERTRDARRDISNALENSSSAKEYFGERQTPKPTIDPWKDLLFGAQQQYERLATLAIIDVTGIVAGTGARASQDGASYGLLGEFGGTQRASIETADRDLVTDVQQRLYWKGFDPGWFDGLLGPRTRAAISAYQRSVGMDPDGRITPELLQRLRGH